MAGKPAYAATLTASKPARDRYATLVKQAKKARDEQETCLPAHFEGWQAQVRAYEVRIKACWKTYERRNREMAHLASNLLILFALLHDCRLICGENLTTLKTIGRGRGVRGRFRSLAQYYDRSRGGVARPEVQMPSAWHTGSPGGAAWHDAHVPQMSSACENLCIPIAI